MLANKIIPDVEGEKEPDFVLDERLFAVPALAIKDSTEVVVGMCHLSSKAFKKATGTSPKLFHGDRLLFDRSIDGIFY